MTKLSIKNIGPIQYIHTESGYIEFNKVTFFTGSQGTGKSTIAKIFSSLSWLEKNLAKYGTEIMDKGVAKDTFKTLFEFHKMNSYFNTKSEFHYIGKKFEFLYQKGKFTFKDLGHSDYSSPKIMYVPSERNFLTTFNRADLIDNLPGSLKDFLKEYDLARKQYAEESIELPIGNISFKYYPELKSSNILGKGFNIDLMHASSGYQSLTPLFLVTRYLSDKVDQSLDINNIPLKDETNLIDKILSILSLETDPFKDASKVLSVVRSQMKLYYPNYFVNIVEEPEQNLHPESQEKILFNLIGENNKCEDNKLVITTHSPYIINYMALSFQGYKLYSKGNLSKQQKSDLELIIPEISCTSSESTIVYEIKNGIVEKLEHEYGFISDSNILNNRISEINYKFSTLIDME